MSKSTLLSLGYYLDINELLYNVDYSIKEENEIPVSIDELREIPEHVKGNIWNNLVNKYDNLNIDLNKVSLPII
jgi:hypothetical protein